MLPLGCWCCIRSCVSGCRRGLFLWLFAVKICFPTCLWCHCINLCKSQWSWFSVIAFSITTGQTCRRSPDTAVESFTGCTWCSTRSKSSMLSSLKWAEMFKTDKRNNNNSYSHHSIVSKWRITVILLDQVDRREQKGGIMANGKWSLMGMWEERGPSQLLQPPRLNEVITNVSLWCEQTASCSYNCATCDIQSSDSRAEAEIRCVSPTLRASKSCRAKIK